MVPMPPAEMACCFSANSYLIAGVPDHRRHTGPVGFIDSCFNSSLACIQLASYLGVHSKTSVWRPSRILITL